MHITLVGARLQRVPSVYFSGARVYKRARAWGIRTGNVEINSTLYAENRTAESAFEILEAASISMVTRSVLAE